MAPGCNWSKMFTGLSLVRFQVWRRFFGFFGVEIGSNSRRDILVILKFKKPIGWTFRSEAQLFLGPRLNFAVQINTAAKTITPRSAFSKQLALICAHTCIYIAKTKLYHRRQTLSLLAR